MCLPCCKTWSTVTKPVADGRVEAHRALLVLGFSSMALYGLSMTVAQW